MKKNVVTYHLEMTDPVDHRRATRGLDQIEAARCEVPSPELNRFFYTAVGGDWYWIDRLPWSYARWMDWLDRPEVQTWVASHQGLPAGYFELEAQSEGDVEIAYFGLLPGFAGRGIGGALLSHAVDRAWQMPARRVWVHTCTLDHPAALANYETRGFRRFHSTEADLDLPDVPPGPWPQARS